MPARSGTAHVVTTARKYKDRVYHTHLLRRSYREGGTVKNEALGNLSHLPDELVDIIRRYLQGEVFVPLAQAFEITRSRAHGHVQAVATTMRRLGFASLMPPNRAANATWCWPWSPRASWPRKPSWRPRAGGIRRRLTPSNPGPPAAGGTTGRESNFLAVFLGAAPSGNTGGGLKQWARCRANQCWRGFKFGGVLSVALLLSSAKVQALCGLEGAFEGQLGSVKNLELAEFRTLRVSCMVCHIGGNGGPRNAYGSVLDTLLDISDREDPARQREAGRRVAEIVSDPSSLSLTFGELIQDGKFPGAEPVTEDAPLPEIPTRDIETLTVERARELVGQVGSESRFGILQLSNVEDISPEVAEVLAEFEGEYLILGIRSLSPAVSGALAKSRAANVWLHSVTSVFGESAESISALRGQLVMTGLTTLDSVELAEKLALRPGSLSFPYLEEISPEVAGALATRDGSLTMAGLGGISREVQEVLSGAAGTLSLPSLTSLDSLALAKKLTASNLVLPEIEGLTPELAEVFTAANTKPASFFSSMILPLATITPEVADVFASHPTSINLTLVGSGPIADGTLQKLLRSKVNLQLRDVEKLSLSQARIVREAMAKNSMQAGTLSNSKLSLPKLKKLDSALLAETFGAAALPSVTEITPEAAAALGSLPEAEVRLADGRVEFRPSGELSFPGLTELSPETARLLLTRRWGSISLASVEDISMETIRSLARATSKLTLGIPTLPAEFVEAFTEIPVDRNMGGTSLVFPRLTELSPEAARTLVEAFNRGTEVDGQVRYSESPALQFGELYGPLSGRFVLAPETAVELAKYDGRLSLGIGEVSGDSARALSSFGGVSLQIGGPAADRLTPDAAEALAKTPATLLLPLRELDSVPLAERFAWQYNRSFFNLESISAESIPPLIKYQQHFDVRKIAVLDSPGLARRFLGNSWGPTLPALTRLSPEAAEIVATSPNSILLGLTVIESPAVATALAKAPKGVKLPRLRAATPEVLAILEEAKSVETPPLSSVYILSAEGEPSAVRKWVEDLGDAQFVVRDEASRRLSAMGLGAKRELLEGLRSDDPEIRWRADRLWEAVRETDFQQRSDGFLNDARGIESYEFPGWDRFREVFGSSQATRLLFLSLQSEEPRMWDEFGNRDSGEKWRFWQRCDEFEIALADNARRSKITAGAALSVLFMESEYGEKRPEEDREWMRGLWELSAVVDMVRSDAAWASLKSEWVRQAGDQRPPFERLMANLREGKESAFPVARELLGEAEIPPNQKQFALLALAESRDLGDGVLLGSYLGDATPIDTHLSGGVLLKSQVRDVALAVLVHRSGGDPKDFGFTYLRPDKSTLYSPSTLGFRDDAAREAAFGKWASRSLER